MSRKREHAVAELPSKRNKSDSSNGKDFQFCFRCLKDFSSQLMRNLPLKNILKLMLASKACYQVVEREFKTLTEVDFTGVFRYRLLDPVYDQGSELYYRQVKGLNWISARLPNVSSLQDFTEVLFDEHCTPNLYKFTRLKQLTIGLHFVDLKMTHKGKLSGAPPNVIHADPKSRSTWLPILLENNQNTLTTLILEDIDENPNDTLTAIGLEGLGNMSKLKSLSLVFSGICALKQVKNVICKNGCQLEKIHLQHQIYSEKSSTQTQMDEINDEIKKLACMLPALRIIHLEMCFREIVSFLSKIPQNLWYPSLVELKLNIKKTDMDFIDLAAFPNLKSSFPNLKVFTALNLWHELPAILTSSPNLEKLDIDLKYSWCVVEAPNYESFNHVLDLVGGLQELKHLTLRGLRPSLCGELSKALCKFHLTTLCFDLNDNTWDQKHRKNGSLVINQPLEELRMLSGVCSMVTINLPLLHEVRKLSISVPRKWSLKNGHGFWDHLFKSSATMKKLRELELEGISTINQKIFQFLESLPNPEILQMLTIEPKTEDDFLRLICKKSGFWKIIEQRFSGMKRMKIIIPEEVEAIERGTKSRNPFPEKFNVNYGGPIKRSKTDLFFDKTCFYDVYFLMFEPKYFVRG